MNKIYIPLYLVTISLFPWRLADTITIIDSSLSGKVETTGSSEGTSKRYNDELNNLKSSQLGTLQKRSPTTNFGKIVLKIRKCSEVRWENVPLNNKMI